MCGKAQEISTSLDKPHPLQARMAMLADDGVVVDGDAERGGDVDDRFRHLDITPLSPPTSIFTLGLGATASADATRKETLNFYYTVDQLRSGRPCPDPNNLEPYDPRDSLLLQNDLKLNEWLLDVIMAVGTREIGGCEKYPEAET